MKESVYSHYSENFEKYLNTYLEKRRDQLFEVYQQQLKELKKLTSSLEFNENHFESYYQKSLFFLNTIKYSLTSGGKRFRPVLVLATADMLGSDGKEIYAYALAVELIHTYSLVHDDLPCMDNDDFRRGQPTSHKKFGESTALLSGDALQTLAFEVLSQELIARPSSQKAMNYLARASGLQGMVGGQFLDLESQKSFVSKEDMLLIQINKTGALIKASIMGAAYLADIETQSVQKLETFATCLGLAFQIKDDLLDSDKKEKGSFPEVFGEDIALKTLKELTLKAQDAIYDFKKNEFLISLCQFNHSRQN